MFRQGKPVKIIMIGFGVVGRSLAEMLSSYSMELKQECGADLKVVAIVDRKGAAISQREGINLLKALQAKKQGKSVSILNGAGKPGYSALEVLEEINGDVVIEVTPTNVETGEPGLTHIKTALSQGKHVITTNKGPLALALPNLRGLARKNNMYLLFSGAVGGGMPILNFVKCLLGEKILSIRGVLNGTTNYILWKMAEEYASFEEVLLEARELGYAEANPLYDIDGVDTACKLVILANVAMNIKAKLGDVKIQGIREITPKEIIEADKDNCALRLVGSINRETTVSPQRISKNDPICVDSVLNAITFTSTYTGSHTLIGKGAGGHETAGSILRDIVGLSQKIKLNNNS